MSASAKLKTHLDGAFALTHDLAEHLDEAALSMDIPGLPSNRVGGPFWCIVGARESYIKAIIAGAWQGFSCGLKSPREKQSVLAALRATCDDLNLINFDELSDAQIEPALALLEHEVQHHGQLIRYAYANRLTFPESWNKRYTV